jgi:hypothetical protein
VQRVSIRLLSWALLAALLALVAPGAAAAQETVSAPALGEAIPYIGTEGDVLALMTVDQVVDPFREYSRDGPPGRGFHFVLVSVTVENTGIQPFAFNAASVRLQDSDGFLYSSGYVTRTPESLAAAPDFPYGDIAPGEIVQGVVLYPVPNAAQLARVVYLPDFSRLLVLGDLRAGDGGGLAAPAPPPEEIRAPGEEIGGAPAGTTSAPGGDDAAVAGASYVNPTFNYRLAWDAAWDVVEAPNNDLGLSNGVSFVAFLGAPFVGDAAACVQEVSSEIASTLPGAARAAEGGTAERPFAAYYFDDATIGPAYYLVECRALVPGEAMLVVSWITARSSVEAQLPVVEALLGGLELPAVTAADPAAPAAVAPAAAGGDIYVNQTYGYRLELDPRWEILPGVGPDDLELSDGTSTVSVMPYPDADARSCVEDSMRLMGILYAELAPMTDEQGVPLQGGDAAMAWAAMTGEDLSGSQRAVLFECRSLAPQPVSILFRQDAPLASYDEAAVAFEALLATLELPG